MESARTANTSPDGIMFLLGRDLAPFDVASELTTVLVGP